MSTENPNQNQRTSFRCTVAESRQDCILRIGQRALPAKLIDESVGGFAILVDELAGLENEQTAELATDAGSFTVRIVHISKVTPTDINIAADRETPCFRLGLVRLGETGLPQEPKASILAGSLRFNLGQFNSLSGIIVVVGILGTTLLVAAPMGWISGAWHAAQFGAKQFMQDKDQQAESHSQESLPGQLRSATGDSPFPAQRSDVRQKSSAFGDGNGHASQSAFSTSKSNRYLRLPGATPLVLPEVVEKLQLTADQQSRIRDLADATSKAMRSLDTQLRGQQRRHITEQREELLKQAREEALKVLTKEQRAEWDAMVGKPK